MTSNTDADKIFPEVLTVGPSRKCIGGIATVLGIYAAHMPGFKHLPTNSPRGTVAGLGVLAATMLRMPFERLRGRRILHVHMASGKSFVRKSWVMGWGRLLGFKIVAHCHSGHIQSYISSVGVERARKVLGRSSALICLTEPHRRYFSGTLGLGNVHKVYNPIEIPAAPPSGAGPQLPLRLLFLGAVVEAKGIFDLLDVFAANAGRWRGKVMLTVGGDGDSRRLTEFIAGHNLADMVDFRGWIDGEEKERMLASHHVMVLPSHAECLPMSILEAMTRGMAVISTTVGGVPEIVADGISGRLVEPRDCRALAQAIESYVDNPGLAISHGRAGFESLSRFYPATIMSGLRGVYSTL